MNKYYLYVCTGCLPGFEALKISRTMCPLNPACKVVTALTSLSVGCLSLQLSGAPNSAST